MKQRLAKLYYLSALLCAALTLNACDDASLVANTPNSTLDPLGVAHIEIVPKDLSIKGIGNSSLMSVTVHLHNGQVLENLTHSFTNEVTGVTHIIEWESNNAFIADVSPNGTVTAVSGGQTFVRAHLQKQYASSTVRVAAENTTDPIIDPFDIPLHAVALTLNPQTMTLNTIGQKVRLLASIHYSDDLLEDVVTRYYKHPSGKISGQLTWQSSDPNIARVSGYGIVTAMGPGQAVITAFDAWDEGFPDGAITVTVSADPGNDPDPGPDPDPEIQEEALPLGADAYVDSVVSHSIGLDGGFGLPEFPHIILGGPQGEGCCTQSLHVLSLGVGGEIVLEFNDYIIFDGVGADFIVFENAFQAGMGPDNIFAEPATVSVSEDGIQFFTFPCNTQDYPYPGCAGTQPTLANVASNNIDPRDPNVAGGNSFDLAAVGLTTARFIKIVDSGLDLGPDGDGNHGFDLDAVSIVHGTSP